MCLLGSLLSDETVSIIYMQWIPHGNLLFDVGYNYVLREQIPCTFLERMVFFLGECVERRGGGGGFSRKCSEENIQREKAFTLHSFVIRVPFT